MASSSALFAGRRRCPVPAALIRTSTRNRRPVPPGRAGSAVPPRQGGRSAAVVSSIILGLAASIVVPWLVNVARAPELASRTRHRLAPAPLDDAASRSPVGG